MAVLGATSLTGCTSIPQFMGTGARTIFRMATSPVSWTKDGGVDIGTLRVVSGTATPGGSVIWDQVFATRPYTSGLNGADDGCSVGAATLSPAITLAQDTFATETTTAQSATLSTAQISPHTHGLPQTNPPGTTSLLASGPVGLAQGAQIVQTNGGIVPGPSQAIAGTGHNHAINTQHNHSFPVHNPHTHVISGQHSHGGYSGSVDFNLTYVDVIVAVKD